MSKVKEIKSKLFITGIIKEKNKRGNDTIAAANIYDIETKSSHVESVDSLKNRLRSSNVAGVKIKTNSRYNVDYEHFNVVETVCFDKTIYDYRKLPELNGKSEVIKEGKGVIIGCTEQNGTEVYVVVNNNDELKYLSKEEVINERPLGVIRNTVSNISKQKISI